MKLYKINIYLFVSILLCFSSNYNAKADIDSTYLENSSSALSLIDKYIAEKNWVNIDLSKLATIQVEIQNNSNKIIDKENFYDYIPLMSKNTMKIVRNTFFAIKGYKFQDKDLQSHYEKYSWYKPRSEKIPKLNDAERKKVKLLKKIEDNWVYRRYKDDLPQHHQKFPNSTKILNEHSKKILKLNDKKIDITTVYKAKHLDAAFPIKDSFIAHGISAWDSVLLCSYYTGALGEDSLKKMELFSKNGDLLYSYEKSGKNFINGLEKCPCWVPQLPDILISYNHEGCCGATWDIFVTFDKHLNPQNVLNCGESTCGGTNLFYEINENNIYLIVFATGNTINESLKGNVKYIEYERKRCSQNAFKSWIFIYQIDHNGTIKIAAEQSKTFHYEPPHTYREVIDTPFNIISLYESHKQNQPYLNGKVATSLKIKNRLLLFLVKLNRKNYEPQYSISVIPMKSNSLDKQ